MGIEVGFFADFPFEQIGYSGSSDIEKFPTAHIFLEWTISNEPRELIDIVSFLNELDPKCYLS